MPALSRPALLPWTTWTFSHAGSDASSVDLVWDMRYQPLSFGPKPVEVLQVRAPRPSYWRAVVLSDFDGLRFVRHAQAIVETRPQGGVLRVAGAAAGRRLRAEVQVEAPVDSSLVAPGQPVRYELPPEAGPLDLSEDGSAQLRIAPSAGLDYVAEGVARNPSARTLRALGPLPRERRRERPELRRGDAPCLRDDRPRAGPGRAVPLASRQPAVGRLAAGLRQGAAGHARRDVPVPDGGCAGGLAAHHARL